MIGKDELTSFKRMWTWLIGYPAHDREYYMKHVVKLDEMWANGCPLSNSTKERECDGCAQLWESKNGTLCTDPEAPLFKWRTTKRQQPDRRSFYAGQVAVLAMNLIQQLERQVNRCVLRRATD